jgi:hypothetical protein
MIEYESLPDPYQDTHLRDLHYFAMKLCTFSYDPKDDYEVEKSWGKTIFFQPNAQLMLPIFFVVKNDERKEIYIVVRGSRHPNDFVTDLIAESVDLYGSESHKGFVESAESVYEMLPWSEITPCIKQGYKILFTGHSLGGATASIVLMHFVKKLNFTNCKCITFGCPGVVTPDASKEWYSLIDSVFHIGDPIPFTCMHNIKVSASVGIDFIAALSKAIIKSFPYFPLTFLDSKGAADTNDTYSLLVPPGKLFAIGQNTEGAVKIIEYKGFEFFDGIQNFLDQSGHLIANYWKTMDMLCNPEPEPVFTNTRTDTIDPGFFPAQPA